MKVNMQTLKENRNVLSAILLAGVLAILVACGGESPTVDVAVVPTETPLALIGTKNAGGITYTAGNGSMLETADVDANKDGVPDRIAADILKQYPAVDSATKAKVDALMSQSKLYRSILAVTYDKLPKTKAEAEAIFYPQEAFTAYCKFDKAFGLSEFSTANNVSFFSNLNSAAKVQRYKEIGALTGYKTDLSRDCK